MHPAIPAIASARNLDPQHAHRTALAIGDGMKGGGSRAQRYAAAIPFLLHTKVPTKGK